MNPKENIEQMRERHKIEIQELQDICEHEIISECMPYMWAPGHFGHCIKVCEFCGKELFTTAQKYIGGFYNEAKYSKPDNWFECAKRKDCHFVNTPYEEKEQK